MNKKRLSSLLKISREMSKNYDIMMRLAERIEKSACGLDMLHDFILDSLNVPKDTTVEKGDKGYCRDFLEEIIYESSRKKKLKEAVNELLKETEEYRKK